MAIHDVALVRRETVAEGTMAFHFSKPAGFTHQAGQSLVLSLLTPPETDSEGDSRTFTIASAPHESNLMIATRMRDTAFKRVLKAMSIGTAVRIDGPNGDMVLHTDVSRPAVFLAGGIGITPFLAMTRQAAHKQLAHRLFLFYSNRRPQDAAFLEELQQREQSSATFRLIATMVEASNATAPWTGETGFIRRDLLERYLPDFKAAVYYFAGPPAMTQAMHDMLAELLIPESAMRYEEFYGY